MRQQSLLCKCLGLAKVVRLNIGTVIALLMVWLSCAVCSPANAIIRLDQKGDHVEYLQALKGVKLKIMVETNNAPFAFLEGNFARPIGYDIDVVYALQRRLSFDLEENRFFPTSTENGFKMLELKEADILIGGITYDEKRLNKSEASKVIFSSGLSYIYSPNTKKIDSLASLKGSLVGVKPNSPAEYYVNRVLGGKAILFHNSVMAFYELAQGKIDAVVADRPSLIYFAKTMPIFHLTVSDDIFDIYSGQFVIYLQKNSPYTEILNKTLNSLEADGTLYKLRKKWFSEQITTDYIELKEKAWGINQCLFCLYGYTSEKKWFGNFLNLI